MHAVMSETPSSATPTVPLQHLPHVPPAGVPLGYPQSFPYPLPPMPAGFAMPPGYGPPPGYELPQGYSMPPGYPMHPAYGMPMPPGYGMPPPGYGYPPVGYAAPPGYPLPPLQAPVFEDIPMAAPMVAEPAAPPALQISRPQAAPPAAEQVAVPAAPAQRSPAPSPAIALTPARETLTETIVPSASVSDSTSAPVFHPPPSDLPPTAPPNRFGQMWQRVGGSSLTFSILVHGAILLVAGLIVVTTSVMSDKAVDFLPGGGTQQGERASHELAHRVQQKKRNKLNQSTPKSRLVSISLSSSISLPDLPPDTLDMPDASSALGNSMKLGSGGFGSAGAGGGFGSGMGSGAVKGMVAMTLFGKLGGEGMPGVFYDMKQTPDRVPTALADLASDADFANVINTAAGKKFSGKGLDQFFHSTQKMSFTYLLIPYMAATEGPKAFKVENEVQPRAWMVHYTADVRPPAPGEYRFVGMFDDALIVYVNGKPVLDGSWYSIVDYGGKQKTEGIRQDFGGPVLPGTGNRKCYAGKWVKMDGLTHIDIVVGERPGGRVGGLLLVQAKKGKYAERADGTPILPVFTTAKPDLGDITRMRDYTAGGFEVSEDPAVFSLTKDIFGGR